MTTKVKIENIVSAITLGKEIDLEELVENVKEFEYDPSKFPGIVYRLRQPRVAMLIFSSGKVICTGARSKDEIDAAVRSLVEKLRKGGVEVMGQPKVHIQNIVASAKLGFKVNLDVLAMECLNTEYEPEQFPGLVLSLEEPKTVMLVFRSGKVIITGAKKPEDADIAARKTEELIKEVGAVIENS